MLSLAAVTLPFLMMPAALPPRTFGSEGRPLVYVVMGDSTAAGVGADYESGIAVQTARALSDGRRVTMTNLGVSGARMRDVIDDQLAAAVALRPDLVLLSVTANDVTHLTSVGSIRQNLRLAVSQLRNANRDVAIVVTGSPDMGSPPRVPRLLRGLAASRTRQINRMMIEEATSLRLTFAPIAESTGPLFRRDRTLFHPDRFHPNERGYATWVAVLNPSLRAALSSGAAGTD